MTRILIIDDHKLFLEGLAMLFSGMSNTYDVHAYNQPEEFIRDLSLHKQADLLICDLFMGETTGLSVISQFRAVNKKCPVLVLSGTAHQPPIAELKRLGAKGFAHKSIESDLLQKVVQDILIGGEYFASDASEDDDTDGNHSDEMTDYDERRPLPVLNRRQSEVLRLIGAGDSNKVIAEKMDISENTVKTYIKQIFELFGVNKRTACIKRAQMLGML